MVKKKKVNKAEKRAVKKTKKKKAERAYDNSTKNMEEQSSNTSSESDSNQDDNQDETKSLKELLKTALKEYPTIAASLSAVILGILAFWEGYGQWWFGFQVSVWVIIPIVAALDVLWVVAFCGYYREAYPERMKEGKEKLKFLSLNTIVMIAIPGLFFGVIGGYYAMKWRLAEKIVILVEPFDNVSEVQDGNASGKDPEGIAEIVKSHLEKSIPLNKRLKVRVVLGKRPEKRKSEEIPLDQRALKYRADMVISGWYLKQDEKILVCPKFQVVRVPERLPAAFMQSVGTYPKTIIFNRKEIENFDVSFILAERLIYEANLVLGACAYASEDWETAQWFLRKALNAIEKLESPEKESETKEKSTKIKPETQDKQREKKSEANKKDPNIIENENLKWDANKVSATRDTKSSDEDSKAKKRGDSSVKSEYLEGDKALIQVYLGHCLMNQGELESAILRYDDAIESGMEVPESDMRYGEILASAYLGRGIAYRQKNAFELAGLDFQTAGGYFPTSLVPRPLRAEEARFLSGDRGKLEHGAKKYSNRGEKYLIQRDYKRAQAYLEVSVELYRMLMRGMPAPIQEKYSLRLAESLIRLGETQNRLAKPDLRSDENIQLAIKHLDEAIKYLDEAIKLTRSFDNQEDPNMLKIRADGLRHLGEAYRAKDRKNEVKKAIGYHQEAKKIWLKLEERENTEEQRTRNVKEAAGEQTRIGIVHRWLDDLDPKSSTNHLQNAIDAHKKAIEKLGGEKYLEILYSDSTDNKDSAKIKRELLNKTKEQITTHHLAHSACNLAETHIKQSLDESAKKKKDRDKRKIEEDIIIACEILEYATECYGVSVEKLHIKKCEKWITRIQEEERNLDLRDDLSWSQTLHGYALLKRTKTSKKDPLGKENVYKKIEDKLKEARDLFNELRYADQGHYVLNLFALTASQVELGKKQEAQQTLLDACNKLRDLTREEKKVWYMDYVYDTIGELIKKEFHVAEKEEDDKENFNNLRKWLKPSLVREGRRALDEIIKSVENRLKKSGEAGS